MNNETPSTINGRGFLKKASAAFTAIAIIVTPIPISSARAAEPNISSPPNLIDNPSFEFLNPNDVTTPLGWTKGNWGKNTAIFTYPVEWQDNGRAVRLQIADYTSGDSKWIFDAVPVISGTQYKYSETYKSDTDTELVIEYRNADDTLSYAHLENLASAQNWKNVEKSFTVPAGAQTATVFHLLEKKGYISIDKVGLYWASLAQSTKPKTVVTAPEKKAVSAAIASPIPWNLISNASVEAVSSDPSIPLNWMADKFSKNTAAFTYPAPWVDGKGLSIKMLSHKGWDAKWYFNHIPIVAGKKYTESHSYRSDVKTDVTLEYKLSDGTFQYENLWKAKASDEWNTFTASFVPPKNAIAVTVLHRIKKYGFLDTDNYCIILAGTGSTGSGSTGSGSSGSGDVTGSGSTGSGHTGGGGGSGGSNTGTGSTWTGATGTGSTGTWSGNDSNSGSGSTGSGSTGTGTWTTGTGSTGTGSTGTGSTGSGSTGTWTTGTGSTWTGSTGTWSTGTGSTWTGSTGTWSTGTGSTGTGSTWTGSTGTWDTVAPVVSITSPTEWAIVTGTTSISISASDNSGVAFVHYSVSNGTDLIMWRLTESPYTVQIPATTLANGSHTISVYAEDAAGNIGNATSVTYQTNNPVTPTSPNLILNPSLETANGSLPANWFNGGWGTNVTTFTYPVAGIDGAAAAQITMTSRTDGDAKWYFEDVNVIPGKSYTFSDKYKSTTASTLTVQYTNSSGALTYVDILSGLPASADWVTATQTVTVPAGMTKMTVFHLINSVGSLTIDNASLTEAAATPSGGGPLDPNAFANGMVTLTFDDGWGSQYDNALPLLNSVGLKGSFFIITDAMRDAVNQNRIDNANLEAAGTENLPAGWTATISGDNNASFEYPVTGVSWSKAAKVSITNLTSGYAAWQPADTTIVEGELYNFTDYYISDVPTTVTVRYTFDNGTVQTNDLGTVPASATWSVASFTFLPPANVTGVTVYHRLTTAGTLTTDEYHLDLSQDYMNPAQVKAMFDAGHEVSAHTKTHPFLLQQTTAQANDEIVGSRQALLDMGITPADTFVYPYGEYNDAILQMVKNSGYIGARSTLVGYNTKATDKYQLQIQEVTNLTTAEQWESWVQTAMNNHTWLILMYHQIDHQNDEFGAKPEELQTFVNYLKNNSIPVVTLHDWINLMNQLQP